MKGRGEIIEAPCLLPSRLVRYSAPCQNWGCRHNLFHQQKKGNRNSTIAKEMKNCVLFVGQPLTLEEVGDLWGLTRERVRQIERQAIIKLTKRFSSAFPGYYTPKERKLVLSLNHKSKIKLHSTGKRET